MRQIKFAKRFLSDKDSNSDSTDSSYDLGFFSSNKRMDLPISISFNDKDKYLKLLKSLIKEEIDTILFENEQFPLLPFELEFEYTEENNCFITVKSPNYKLFEKNAVDIYNEDKIIIENAKIRFKKEDSAILYYESAKKHFKNGIYQIQLKESIKNYERILKGLKNFSKKNLMNENITQMLLGQNPDLKMNIRKENIGDVLLIPKLKEENIKLNEAQETAIKNALMFHLSEVIGPPGSGKTLLLVNLVYNVLQKKASSEKILICAPTNKAIDNIIILLKKFEFEKFVRVLSPAKELSEDLDTSNSVHKLALGRINANPKKYKDLKQLIEKKEQNCILSDSDYKKYKKHMEDIEGEIIEEAEIVLSTINNSADERLKNYYFSYVLIDEAAQALEAETLLPLIHQAQMVVLIGDDKQLGPVVHSKEAKSKGLGMSLFERIHLLYNGEPFITLLNEQYRMNEKLYEFPNRKFYENKMISKRNILPDENIMNNLPFPKKDFPSFFINVSGTEETENKSYFNSQEVLSVFKCVNELNKNKVEFRNIGVITFYSAQKQRLYEKFYTKEKYQELKIDSVDGFQGMELDYIILSTVRSNLEGIRGFLNEEKRLNVSLTRARKGLILVGDAKCLAKRPGIFRDLIKFYCSNGLILNNPFSNNREVVKEEELFNKNLLEVEEDYDEIVVAQNEMNYLGRRIVRIRIKNEKPAPAASVPINPQNQLNENSINNNEAKEKNNDNNRNVDRQIKNKKEEEKKQVPEVKKKKKKKDKKFEEEKKEEEDQKEEEDLKKKGNKKWRIKNLYNKKKISEPKFKEEEESKIEEEKKDEEDKEDKKGKKGKKNKAKQNDNENEIKDKKNNKNKGKGKKK